MRDFKVGDEVVIVGNKSLHMFSMGTKVRISSIDNFNGINGYYCHLLGVEPAEDYLDDDGWWCTYTDIELCEA